MREDSKLYRGMLMAQSSESLQVIKRGCEELLVEQELVDKLSSGRPLRVKAGFDPTAPESWRAPCAPEPVGVFPWSL